MMYLSYIFFSNSFVSFKIYIFLFKICMFFIKYDNWLSYNNFWLRN